MRRLAPVSKKQESHYFSGGSVKAEVPDVSDAMEVVQGDVEVEPLPIEGAVDDEEPWYDPSLEMPSV